MGLFSKKEDNESRSINLSFVDGINGYAKETAVALTMDNENECLTIKARVLKKQPVHLKFEQITGVNVVSESEIIEKSKSTVGRAVAGGVVLGPLGAIVGGMSGIGTKQKSETHYFMIINYRSREEEIKVLSFEIVGFSNWAKFVKELKSKIKTQPVLEDTNIYL